MVVVLQQQPAPAGVQQRARVCVCGRKESGRVRSRVASVWAGRLWQLVVESCTKTGNGSTTARCDNTKHANTHIQRPLSPPTHATTQHAHTQHTRMQTRGAGHCPHYRLLQHLTSPTPSAVATKSVESPETPRQRKSCMHACKSCAAPPFPGIAHTPPRSCALPCRSKATRAGHRHRERGMESNTRVGREADTEEETRQCRGEEREWRAA